MTLPTSFPRRAILAAVTLSVAGLAQAAPDVIRIGVASAGGGEPVTWAARPAAWCG